MGSTLDLNQGWTHLIVPQMRPAAWKNSTSLPRRTGRAVDLQRYPPFPAKLYREARSLLLIASQKVRARGNSHLAKTFRLAQTGKLGQHPVETQPDSSSLKGMRLQHIEDSINIRHLDLP